MAFAAAGSTTGSSSWAKPASEARPRGFAAILRAPAPIIPLTHGLTLTKLTPMRRTGLNSSSLLRLMGLWLLLGAGACSGSLSCSSCGGTALAPIPGGFDTTARIERAAQVRLSPTGMDFLEGRFSDLVNAYARQSCGTAEDVPCAQSFGTTCDATRSVCVDAGGVPQPVVGFEIEYTTQGSAVVCRDDVNDPMRRDCYAWLRLEGLALTPEAPNRLRADVTSRLVSTVIPIRYANSILDLDCIVTLDSANAGSPLQDIELVMELVAWSGPAGVSDGQLQLNVVEVNAVIPDEDLTVAGDPVHGGTGDALACGGLNALGSLKAALISQLTDELGSIIEGQIDEVFGRTCGAPTDAACASGTTCNTDGFCEYAGRVVPAELGLEGRADFASLLGGFGGGRPGQTDIAFLVGGQSTADPQGVTVGAIGGAELVTLDPTCAQDLPSPRLRPTFATPPALPTDGQADLDFDGSPETDYMVAAGLSEAFMDQVMWSLYGSGLFCQRISAADIDLLNTGSLGLLVPSLGQITHSDKYPWAVYPASMTLTPTAEPTLRLGSGQVNTSGSSPELVEPLIEIILDDVRLDFYAMLEERWMRLMTIQADITLGLGATVNPANEIELVIGDLSQAVTDVQVSNSDLLAESPQELADAIPALIQLTLPQITGSLPSIPLPGAESLGGFDLQVLGVRGIEGGTAGLYENAAVYADLDFVPALAGNLRASVQTLATVAEVKMPALEAMSVPGGAQPTQVTIDVSAAGAAPGEMQYQARVDAGLWSTFMAGPRIVLQRASLSVPGRHTIEVRARQASDYRTLDPTPVQLDIVIDPEPPRLDVRTSGPQHLQVRAVDRVSRERVQLSLHSDGLPDRALVPDAQGRVRVPELAGEGELSVIATDEQGLFAEVVVRAEGVMQVPEVEAPAQVAGCTCLTAASIPRGAGWLGLAGLVLALRRRRR